MRSGFAPAVRLTYQRKDFQKDWQNTSHAGIAAWEVSSDEDISLPALPLAVRSGIKLNISALLVKQVMRPWL